MNPSTWTADFKKGFLVGLGVMTAVVVVGAVTGLVGKR